MSKGDDRRTSGPPFGFLHLLCFLYLPLSFSALLCSPSFLPFLHLCSLSVSLDSLLCLPEHILSLLSSHTEQQMGCHSGPVSKDTRNRPQLSRHGTRQPWTTGRAALDSTAPARKGGQSFHGLGAGNSMSEVKTSDQLRVKQQVSFLLFFDFSIANAPERTSSVPQWAVIGRPASSELVWS